MKENELIEWDRKTRIVNGSVIVCLPREWSKHWNLTRGSLINFSLREDGSLILLPSKKELDYQRKIKEMEVKQ
ncbi:MAG: AbrB/MazE/SpoVT family DNA-binding domain-containing protein [Cuniculiplasma sp.]